MKVKTSITLSENTLQALDRVLGPGENRSRLIEQAVLDLLEQRRRAARETRDLEILNRSADELNREAADVLSYQVDQ